MTSRTSVHGPLHALGVGCAPAKVLHIFNFRLAAIFALAFIALAGDAAAATTTIPYTVTVEHQGQPVPNMMLIISVSDGIANSGYSRYAKTDSQGSFSSTATFECGSTNSVQFGIGAVKVLSTAAIEAGGGSGGSRSCADLTPVVLALATGGAGSYDRHNAGDGCLEMLGEPVNVTNGNMFIRHADYFLPGNGIPISIDRSYNSMINEAGFFGVGWTSEIDEKLVISCTGPFQCNTDYLIHYSPDGRINHFAETSPWQYKATNSGNHARVQRYSDWSRDLIFKDGRVHRFDHEGRLLWKRDRNGNETTFTRSGLTITITDPHGRALTITRNSTTGRVSQISDSTGVIATYSYDTGNPYVLKTVTYPDGSQFKFEYDTTTVSGLTLLTTVKDALDNVVEDHEYESHNGHGRATTSEIHGGAEKYEFDYSNWTSSTPFTVVKHKKNSADPYIESKYFFETNRFRNAVTKTEGVCGCGGSGSEVTQLFYDDHANLTKTIDALGRETTFTYDASGNRLSRTDVFGTQQFTYNSFGQVLTYKDRIDQSTSSNTAVLTYDPAGNLTSYTDALGKVTTIAYPTSNNKGLPDSITDARNNTTKFKWFTTSGLLEEIEDPYTKKTTFTWDPRGRLKTTTNALTHVTTYNYFDDTQRKVELIYPNSDKITYKYDIRRTLESLTDERGKITAYEFDPQYRLKKITDPLGHVKEFGYDLMSNLASYKDPLGKITDYHYDDFNRMKEIEYPAATSGATRLKERFEYDKLGRRTKYYDTADRLTQHAYDDVTRTNTVTNAELETAQIKYNQRFQTFEVKDALNQTYTFAFDPLGRMLSQTRAGGTMSFEYNEVGAIKKRIDYLGRETEYSYDNLNRLSEIEYLPTGLGSSTFSTYVYDDVSRLASATNAAGSITFAYDNRNRVTSTTDVVGHTIDYEYERTTTVNQRRLKFDGAMYAVYNFDNADRLSSIVNSSDSTTVTFGYDDEDKVISRAYPNGVTTTYQYFDNDLLKRITDASSSTTLFDRQYTYNSARQISQIVEPTRSRTFGYDNADRLTSVTDATYGNESYNYDDVGNRTSSHLSTTYGYQSGQFNRLTSTNSATYQFDANGNTVQKTEGLNSWQYAWNHDNRMTTATVGTDSAEYTYDALGRRVRRYVAGGAEDTKFIHDGLDVLVDDDGGTLTKYLNGGRIDKKLRVQQGSSVNYLLADHLGSTSGLTDSWGAITSQTAYDSFGNQTASMSTRYGFTGRERDDFSGLMYYRARFYDPNLGRFMSEDPIGFGGGDVNLYGYVWSDPMHYTDPMGLDGWGNDTADWTDARIKIARDAYQGGVEDWVWNGTINTLADLTSMAVDPLRVGSGVGDAVYRDDLSAGERALSVLADIGRGAAIAAPAASLLGRSRYIFPRFGRPQLPTQTAGTTKWCPNPYGKKGGPKHQAKVSEVARDVADKGLRVETEFAIETPNGLKVRRYADVVGLDAEGNVVEIHQVGRKTKGGNPVSRERQAMDDIRRANGISPTFHEY